MVTDHIYDNRSTDHYMGYDIKEIPKPYKCADCGKFFREEELAIIIVNGKQHRLCRKDYEFVRRWI